jgi:hypothetical protein
MSSGTPAHVDQLWGYDLRENVDMHQTFDWIFFGIVVPPLILAVVDLFKIRAG